MTIEPPEAAPASAGPSYRNLLPGDRLPSLNAPCGDKPRFNFHVLAGRYQLYGFFLAADRPQIMADLAAVTARRDLFNDQHCSFVGVSVRRRDRDAGVLRNLTPGVRFAWDLEHTMSRACSAVPIDSVPGAPTGVRRRWVLVDPSLRVIRIFEMSETPVEAVIAAVAALPPPDQFGGVHRPAPILLLPNVLEPELCQELIGLYDTHGGLESGIHRDGQGVLDHGFKRRKDHILTDARVIDELKRRVARRVLPEVERLFYMRASYVERHIVGCYTAEDGGHFSPHTDNGPGLTAHRRFAVSINLTDDFDGGEVVFPEYNQAGYKAPAGWAIVFPCAALHAVRKVRRGARYAYLPFIYDEAGREIRDVELRRRAAEAAAAA